MAKTYEDIRKQIDELTREAERLKRKEVDGVIARIKEAIAIYGLTAADLGLKAKRGRPAGVAAKPGPRAAKGTKGKSGIKYRDDSGNTWGGRGPRPQWLRDALSSGRQLSDFLA